ncbi:hypothetical protein HWV00_04425 [Moritella sp. 24]|uniref:hypothetical protein n=1 Tax=Moritella sp. 24 TaxID=2746230 RepID=UPI001BA8D4E0|nr:hypothetical protein [Moritella sp. 24]QUM75540.1 hypothetical protein HWV00_04425 [Moritella sp. 24]
MKKFIKENTLSITSIFIALCALVLTTYQSFSTNYHNRISSLPLVQSSIVMFKDGRVALYFENAGNGPAIVTGFEVAGERADSVRQVIDKFVKDNDLKGDEFSLLTTKLSARTIIKAGDKLEVATLHMKNDESESYQAVAFAIKSLPVTLCYISLYQDELYATTSQKYVLAESCAYEGATNIFGKWVKFKMPFSSKVDQSQIFGN